METGRWGDKEKRITIVSPGLLVSRSLPSGSRPLTLDPRLFSRQVAKNLPQRSQSSQRIDEPTDCRTSHRDDQIVKCRFRLLPFAIIALCSLCSLWQCLRPWRLCVRLIRTELPNKRGRRLGGRTILECSSLAALCFSTGDSPATKS